MVDVERRLVGGFARGVLILDGTGADDAGQDAADRLPERESDRPHAATARSSPSCPDLICIVDADTAEPITTEIVRYGLRVEVLGIPAPEALKTPAALAVIGPAAFGYADVAYVPLPGRFGGAAQPAGAMVGHS